MHTHPFGQPPVIDRVTELINIRTFKDGKPNRKEAAYALHKAVKALRESGVQCVSWVPFIDIRR
jgi:hypothetical protein